MPAYHDEQYSPYTPEQLFELVADVERYPEFLPWCRAARVMERTDDSMMAELVIHFKHITQQYTSKVILNHPHTIDVVMTEGPFDHLTNSWRFTPHDNGGTTISFDLDFAFKSRWLETLIGALFSRATEKMVTAFSDRAKALYG